MVATQPELNIWMVKADTKQTIAHLIIYKWLNATKKLKIYFILKTQFANIHPVLPCLECIPTSPCAIHTMCWIDSIKNLDDITPEWFVIPMQFKFNVSLPALPES